MRSPRPAWVSTIARYRGGIASARACTWATDNGATRSRVTLGRLTRTTGLVATLRSSTASA
jgi:hypothetical protein